MSAAARVSDTTTHGGIIVGPGVTNVTIGGMPAAVSLDNHICAIPPNSGHLTLSVFASGSATVLIGGKPALRTSDMCLCGATAAVGCPTVIIGG